MQLLGKVVLKTVELPNALEFVASREENLIESFIIPAFALIVLWWFWRTGNLWLRIIAGVAAAFTMLAAAANRIQGGETKLRVTSNELVAEGNLGRLFSTHENVPVGDLSSIRYEGGGDGEIFGLYARRGWRSTLLLPYLSVAQANEIADTIGRKFPGIPAEQNSPASLSDLMFFGSGDQTTTLGLSDPGKKEERDKNV